MWTSLCLFWNVIKLVWLCASGKKKRKRKKNTCTFLFFSFEMRMYRAALAVKYLQGMLGCCIFVIQLAVRGRNQFCDELSTVTSPLTFQRYAAFPPCIYCNLFFFLLFQRWAVMCGQVMNCKWVDVPCHWSWPIGNHTPLIGCRALYVILSRITRRTRLSQMRLMLCM